jgi:hypothetical protein
VKTKRNNRITDSLVENSVISINRRVLERRTYMASSSLSSHVVENNFDRRFLIRPFGVLSQRRVRSNYLIKVLKYKVKIEL